MSAKEKVKEKAAKAHAGEPGPAKEPEMAEGSDVEAYEAASAKDLPRPRTSLGVSVKKDISKLTVSLLGDVGSAPALGDVEKVNKKGEGEGRTPLMTVIQAVLAKGHGSMPLGELTAQTRKYWHRPFPTSPYTDEELVYLLVRNSDSVRVS